MNWKTWCGILWLMAVAAGAAGENLLKNPDFSVTGKNGIPADWTLHESEPLRGRLRLSRSRDGGISGNAVKIAFTPGAGRGQSWLVQRVSGLPGSRWRLQVKSRVKVLDSTAEFEVTVGVFFLDAAGKWLSYRNMATLAYRSEKWIGATKLPAPSWMETSGDFTAPADTALIGIRLNVTGPGIEAEWAEARLTPTECSIASVLDAVALPETFPSPSRAVSAEGVTLTPDWSWNGAEIRSGTLRRELLLNGLWAYRPAGATEEWAYLKVPSRVRAHRPASVLYGNQAGYRLDADGPRWLYRTVELPHAPAGSSFHLKFEALHRLALRIFWNGRKIADLSDGWGGEVEIPSGLLTPGNNALLLLALPRGDANETAYLYASGTVRPYEAIKQYHDATLYDVSLVVKPPQARLERVRLTPDWRRKALCVSFPAAGIPEEWRFDAKILDRQGKMLLGKNSLAPRRAGDRLELELSWPEPVSWTPDTPALLDFILTARNAAGEMVDEILPVRFGFRQVWREGKKLFLNGQELRLRPKLTMIYDPLHDPDYLRRSMEYCNAVGFNTLLRLSDMGQLEESFHGTTAAQVADELGMFVIAYLPYQLVSGGQFFSRSVVEVDSQLLRYMEERVVERFFNHPSVIAYSGFGTSANLGGNLSYANQPDRWGVEPVDSEQAVRKLEREKVVSDAFTVNRLLASIRFVEAVRRLDPSRPFLSHYDSGAGDGWGVFDYFNWTPVQEWEEWIVPWIRNGIKPIGSWEHGNPYPMSFVNHAIPDGDGEPWVTEYAAAHFGEAAYEWETPEYRALIRKCWNPALRNYGRGHFANAFVNRQQAVQRYWADFNTRLYRSWRLAGLNMGIEPFGPASNYIEPEVLKRGHGRMIADPTVNLKTHGAKTDRHLMISNFPNEAMKPTAISTTGEPEGLTAFGRALRENNRPFLGFIAGGGDNPMNKIHIYRPGERVEKSFGMVYDGFIPLSVRAEGTVRLDGQILETPAGVWTFPHSAIRREKFSFTIPAKTTGTLERPGRGEIEVIFRDGSGQELGRDRFTFSVVARPEFDRKGIVLFDPDNTAGQAADFAERRVCSSDGLRQAGLVMIAPGALSAKALRAVPAGTPMLVMAQPSTRLEELGFRTYPIRARRFWPDSAVKVAPELLRDWRGGRPNRTGDSFAPLRKGYNNTSGTTGMVAESVIETPTAGNFTPLIHGGFDLAMTPLLKTVWEGRPVLFSQLEFAANATDDPAAEALLIKLLTEWKQEKAPELSAPSVLGDAGLLVRLGAEVSHNGLPESGPVFVTDLKPEDVSTLHRYVELGGIALLLPQPDRVYREFGISFSRVRIACYPAEVPGLNAGNFHARQELELTLFNGKPVAERQLGQGRMILVGFDPRRINVQKEPYLALTQKRQYRALSQLATNAGIRLAAPERLLSARLEHPPVEWPVEDTAKLRSTTERDDGWQLDAFDDSSWSDFRLSKNNTMLPDAQLRLQLTLTPEQARERQLELAAGSFDDFDEIWLNGVKLGWTTPENTPVEQAWSIRRRYPIPDGVLKAGKNVLALHVWNRNGARGWKAQVRGPIVIVDRYSDGGLYPGLYRHCDDPYLLHQW